MSMVYFIQCGEDGPIKIGHTNGNVVWRLRQLQHSSPHELRILGVHEGDVSVERQLHERFAQDRVRSEWFNPSADLMAHIDRNGGYASFEAVDRSDLRKATSREARASWTLAQRNEYRDLGVRLGRQFSGWREHMLPITPAVASAIEGFLASKAKRMEATQ